MHFFDILWPNIKLFHFSVIKLKFNTYLLMCSVFLSEATATLTPNWSIREESSFITELA